MRTRSQTRKEILEKEKEEEVVTMGEPIANANANTKALMDFFQPKINDIQSSIVRPAIAANTFEIKLGTIQIVQNSVQFEGFSHGRP